jgi:hypothetical protein
MTAFGSQQRAFPLPSKGGTVVSEALGKDAHTPDACDLLGGKPCSRVLGSPISPATGGCTGMARAHASAAHNTQSLKGLRAFAQRNPFFPAPCTSMGIVR